MKRSIAPRALPALVCLLAAGCSTVQSAARSVEEDTQARASAADYVFRRPIDEVWPHVRTALEEAGYPAREGTHGYAIETELKTGADAVHVAYLAEGFKRPGNTSVVRIWKVVRIAFQAARPGEAYIRQYQGHKMPVFADGTTITGEYQQMPTKNDYAKRPTLFALGDNYRADRDLRMEREVIDRAAPEDGVKMGKLITLRLEPESRPSPLQAALAARAERQEQEAKDEAGQACGGSIDGADVLQPGTVVLLGEQYGTSEIPAFVGRLACIAARRGVPVSLGVEIPVVEARWLQAYLKTDSLDRSRFLGSLFWSRPQQDGRSSAAILTLLDRVRELRAAGLPVEVFPYDVHDAAGNAREQAMARNVERVRDAHPDRAVLVLTGNVHARTTAGVPWDRTFTPMGMYLGANRQKLVSLDAHYTGGQAWQCKLDGKAKVQCDSYQVEPPVRKLPTHFRGEIAPNRVVRFDAPDGEGGFNGVFYVGALTASPPARTAAAAASR